VIDPRLLLVYLAIALAVWIGGAIGHGVKKAGHLLKHAGETIVHVVHR
jgi:hypothetical protein